MKENIRGNRKMKTGVVVSDKMDKTVVVRVERKLRHPRYHKVIVRGKRYHAHCPNGKPAVGDVVTIRETRPLSKNKHWLVVNQETKV